MKKRLMLVIVLMVFCLSEAHATGFSDNPAEINKAAQSVMMLEVYDKNGDLIATGSGFVAFDNRHVVTNYHVAEDADIIYAYSDSGDPYIIMDVCIADSIKDIAVLQFFSPTDLSPLALNESGEAIRASRVVAIGSPKGFSNTISTGIISALYEENGVSYIQFTAPISNGSSGGALFNDDGQVIGITSLIYDDGNGVSQNLNFAVNIEEVIDLYNQWDGNKYKLEDLKAANVVTPAPTYTLAPTSTPAPTYTPIPTKTPIPEETPGELTVAGLVKCQHYNAEKKIDLRFVLKNYSPKTIVKCKISVSFCGRTGNPLKGLNTIQYKEYELNLVPGKSVWTVWREFVPVSNAFYVNGSIDYIEYSDGTVEKAHGLFTSITHGIR